MTKIAFIGLGAMGCGMASRLLDAGFEVSVYNRTAEKCEPLVGAGAVAAISPKLAVNDADAVFVMVSDNWASHEVWLGEEGILAGKFADGALAIECSTLSHNWVLELAGRAKGRKMKYIDCPVTGLPDAAATGELVLFAGADIDHLDEARRFLAPLCQEIIHFGDVGTGTAYKLIVNLMGAVQIAAAAEGFSMAEKAGLDMTQVSQAFCSGQAASPQVVRNVKRMLKAQHDSDLIFSGSMRLKDTLYGVQLADGIDAKADFANVAAGCFQKLVDKGLGDFNECKVVDMLRLKS
jgi:3-hydroxyisobutyrate dehydrogenase